MNSLARDITVNIAPGANYPDEKRSCQSASCRVRLSGYGTIVVCQAVLLICALARAITGRQHCATVKLGGVQRALDAASAFIQDVRVDHRGLDAGVSQQFLHGSDVVAVLQQMRCEGVPKRVAGGAFGDSRAADGVGNLAGESAFMEVMAAGWPRFSNLGSRRLQERAFASVFDRRAASSLQVDAGWPSRIRPGHPGLNSRKCSRSGSPPG